MPTVWRIVKAKHAAHAFNGEGAFLYGGRWNSPGVRVVYTAQSASLAALEMLVHLGRSDILSHYVRFAVHLDDTMIRQVDASALPPAWRDDPAPVELQEIGDDWALRRESLAMAVPSAVVDTETNILINPSHPDFPDLIIEPPQPFRFDPRLK